MIVEMAAASGAATCTTLAVALLLASRRVPEDQRALRDAAVAQAMLGSGMVLRIWHPTLGFGPLLPLCIALYAAHAAWLTVSVRALLGLRVPSRAYLTLVGPVLIVASLGLVWPSIAHIGVGFGFIGQGLLLCPFGYRGGGRPGRKGLFNPIRVIGLVSFSATLGMCAWGTSFIVMPERLERPDTAPLLAATILIAALMNMIAACCYLLAVMRRLLDRIETHASRDPLTGALNRRGLAQHLERRGRKLGEHTGLIAIDLDHFKRINDNHGHAGGDVVLTECSSRLRATLRDLDALTRMGGEEFLIIVEGVEETTLCGIAERLRLCISERPILLPDGQRVVVTISLGVALQAPRERLEQGMQRADRALYRAKQEGRNRWTIASREDELEVVAA